MRGSGRTTERLVVYVPRQLKAEILDLVGLEGGSLSAFVVSLLRQEVRRVGYHEALRDALAKKAGMPTAPPTAPPATPRDPSKNSPP